MQARRGLVLKGEQAVEALGNLCADLQHRGAFDAQRGAGAKVHHRRKPCCWRRSFTSERRQNPARFVFGKGRQGMKQRYVGRHLVALCRVMRAAQRLDPGLKRRGQFCGNDQRSGSTGARQGIIIAWSRLPGH